MLPVRCRKSPDALKNFFKFCLPPLLRIQPGADLESTISCTSDELLLCILGKSAPLLDSIDPWRAPLTQVQQSFRGNRAVLGLAAGHPRSWRASDTCWNTKCGLVAGCSGKARVQRFPSRDLWKTDWQQDFWLLVWNYKWVIYSTVSMETLCNDGSSGTERPHGELKTCPQISERSCFQFWLIAPFVCNRAQLLFCVKGNLTTSGFLCCLETGVVLWKCLKAC